MDNSPTQSPSASKVEKLEEEEETKSWGHESDSDLEVDAVSLDKVELREVLPPPRKLDLEHGFMRYIVSQECP